MSAMEKSDLSEVAMKRANKAVSVAAEPVERRGWGQGQCGSAKHGPDAEPGGRVKGADPHTRSHHQEQKRQTDGASASHQHRCLTGELLRAEEVRCSGGVDEMTWAEYAETLEANLGDLHSRVHTGAYRALPSRRKYIPKAEARQTRAVPHRHGSLCIGPSLGT